MSFDITTFDVQKFDTILTRGLSQGLGSETGSMCIEAAICSTLGLPHSDDPQCVTASVRTFKIRLNDSRWSSPEARAKGLRDLGLAQLGSKGVVDSVEFARRLAKKTIQVLLPALFRDLYPGRWTGLVDACERDGNAAAARALYRAAYADAPDVAATYAATYAAAYAAYAAAAYAAAAAEAAAAEAAAVAGKGDKYLILSAALALDTLRELGSPGIALLQETRV